MPRASSKITKKPSVKELEAQIAELQEMLRAEVQRKESLWNEISELLLSNGELALAEDSAEELATQISDLLSNWVNRQREKLGQKIAESKTLKMPLYTDCLNDLVYALSPPGTKRYEPVEPLEVPVAEADVTAWEEEPDLPLPEPPGRRENFMDPREQPPMDKLNTFNKRVNVPKPRRQPT
jgi:hypothetical protein